MIRTLLATLVISSLAIFAHAPFFSPSPDANRAVVAFNLSAVSPFGASATNLDPVRYSTGAGCDPASYGIAGGLCTMDAVGQDLGGSVHLHVLLTRVSIGTTDRLEADAPVPMLRPPILRS